MSLAFLKKLFLRLFLFLFVLPVLLFGVFVGSVYYVDYNARTPCSQANTYEIQTVDNRFGLSKEAFSRVTSQAAESWNKAFGKTLFVENQSGEISVNLVFDERQELKNQLDNLDKSLTNKKTSLDSQIAEYEALKSSFEQKLASLNQQIVYWNAQGGAPEKEYNRLKEEQAALKKEAATLNALGKKLNQQTIDYNQSVGEVNQTSDDFNSTLSIKPEEGTYNPSEKKIEVYFNNGEKELLATLIHEFGHALTLEHTSDPKSIMYPSASEDGLITSADLFKLSETCRKPTWQESAERAVENLRNRLNLVFEWQKGHFR